MTSSTARAEPESVVIVGGGVIGSSAAWHLIRDGYAGRVTVVERDETYVRSSSYNATGGIRQQYGSALNVAMARYSVAFWRRFDDAMAVDGRSPAAWFRQRGYLFLADAATAPRLERRYAAQRASGANVERLTRSQVAALVPDLVLDDIALAVFGPEDGYLNPRHVLAGLRRAAQAAGAEYRFGEVIAIDRDAERVRGVRLRAADGTEHGVAASVVVNAAGAYAASVGALAGLTLPIAPVRQHLFRCRLTTPLSWRIPMVFDPDGTHWRLDDATSQGEPDRLVIGRSKEDEPPGENFACDWPRLEREMLPTLRRRSPALADVEPMEGWAGLYEMTPDHNALVGEHPSLGGFVIAAGFSGHGLMMSPATGKAVSELVRLGRCTTFDITPLAPDRFERGVRFEDEALV